MEMLLFLCQVAITFQFQLWEATIKARIIIFLLLCNAIVNGNMKLIQNYDTRNFDYKTILDKFRDTKNVFLYTLEIDFE